MRHVDNMREGHAGAPSLIVAYGYMTEGFFVLLQRRQVSKRFMSWNRMTGPLCAYYWCLIVCNISIAPVAMVQKGARERGRNAV